MQTVSLFEAKTHLSRLVESIASGVEDDVVISRNGKPVARMVPIAPAGRDVSKRLGVAKGEFMLPDSNDEHNDEVTRLFAGNP
jgi:prevent-host-death family protein